MGDKKGQIALYVLAGVILLIIVFVILFSTSQKKAEIESMTEKEALQNDPALAAEKARMQQRLNDCLTKTAAESIAELRASERPLASFNEAEGMLATDIASKFPGCFYQFNTKKLQITSENAPTVTATLTNDRLFVTAEYSARGTLDDKYYTLSEYAASTETNLKQMLQKGFEIRDSLLDKKRRSFSPGAEFIDENCYVDLYAYEDQGWYADLSVNEDGTMTAYFYDYNDFLEGLTREEPRPIVVKLPACIPTNPESGEQTTETGDEA